MTPTKNLFDDPIELDPAIETIVSTPDRYPPIDRRVSTTLRLLPEDLHAIAFASLDTGIDRASLIRRALIVAGLIGREGANK